MKKFALALAALGFAGTAIAQDVADADGDGVYSMEELLATYPAMTADDFALVDANGDGAVDAEELTAAQDAGLLAN
jgi:hypothetical protein